jgi:hypothetical protein
LKDEAETGGGRADLPGFCYTYEAVSAGADRSLRKIPDAGGTRAEREIEFGFACGAFAAVM